MSHWMNRCLAAGALVGLVSCATGPQPAQMVEMRAAPPLQPAGRADEAPYQGAVSAIGRRDYALALDLLQMARTRDPGDPRVPNALGVVYDKLGRFDLSGRYYEQAKALDPKSVIVAQNLAYSNALQLRQDGLPAATPPASAEIRTAAQAAPPAPVERKPAVVADVAPVRVDRTPVATKDAEMKRVALALPEPAPRAPVLIKPVTSVGGAAPPRAPVEHKASVVADAAPTRADRKPPMAENAEMKRVALAPREPAPRAPIVLIQPVTPQPVGAVAPSRPPVKANPSPQVASALPQALPAQPRRDVVASLPARAPSDSATSKTTVRRTEDASPRRQVAALQPSVEPSPKAPQRVPVASKPKAVTPRNAEHPVVVAAANRSPQLRTVALAPAAPKRAVTRQAPPAQTPAVVRVSRVAAQPSVAPAPRTVALVGRSLTLVNASGRQSGAEATRLHLVRRGWSAPSRFVRTGSVAQRTTIRYPQRNRQVALALARTLPFPARLEACNTRCVGISILIGADSLRWTGRRAADIGKARKLG